MTPARSWAPQAMPRCQTPSARRRRHDSHQHAGRRGFGSRTAHMAHLPDTPYTRRRRTGQCCRSDRRRAPNIRHRACGSTCVRTSAQGDGMARGGGGAARQRQLRSTLGADSCTGMASFGSAAAHRHRGHICALSYSWSQRQWVTDSRPFRVIGDHRSPTSRPSRFRSNV